MSDEKPRSPIRSSESWPTPKVSTSLDDWALERAGQLRPERTPKPKEPESAESGVMEALERVFADVTLARADPSLRLHRGTSAPNRTANDADTGAPGVNQSGPRSAAGRGGRPQNIPIDVGKLKAARGSMTQRGFTRMLGLHVDTISRAERGGTASQRTIDAVERWSRTKRRPVDLALDKKVTAKTAKT
jgi:hypothetical protein